MRRIAVALQNISELAVQRLILNVVFEYYLLTALECFQALMRIACFAYCSKDDSIEIFQTKECGVR
ncbi:hypothetical protein D2E45_23935 [Mycobacteroides abscessus]|nr:hypothetical protein D2E45_23935 [Mycobacteroides abscessus]